MIFGGMHTQGSSRGARNLGLGYPNPFRIPAGPTPYGLRRQSDSGDGAFERTTRLHHSERLARAKAVSPLSLCHRSPYFPGLPTAARWQSVAEG